jgi:hypothetical protein
MQHIQYQLASSTIEIAFPYSTKKEIQSNKAKSNHKTKFVLQHYQQQTRKWNIYASRNSVMQMTS